VKGATEGSVPLDVKKKIMSWKKAGKHKGVGDMGLGMGKGSRAVPAGRNFGPWGEGVILVIRGGRQR